MTIKLQILCLLTVLCSCRPKTFDEKVNNILSGSIPLIYPEELKEKQENIVILDVRTLQEYQVSHLAKANHIDYKIFNAKKISHIPTSANVVIYCTVGYRSERIGEKMRNLNYKTVYNLYGGIIGWKNHGLMVVNRAGCVTDSVHTYNKRWSKWLLNGIKVYE